jgi:hypothetical protein
MLFLALLAVFSFIYSVEFFRDIVSDDEGLHIPFLWKQYVIPWEEVVATKPVFFRSGWLVQMHSPTLAPFRCFDGWFYLASFRPSIVYLKSISNVEELTKRIKKAAAYKKGKPQK